MRKISIYFSMLLLTALLCCGTSLAAGNTPLLFAGYTSESAPIIYDGEMHLLEITGETTMPSGVVVTYYGSNGNALSAGNYPTNAGAYTAVVRLETSEAQATYKLQLPNSEEFSTENSVTYPITIDKCVLSIVEDSYTATGLVYNGERQTPTYSLTGSNGKTYGQDYLSVSEYKWNPTDDSNWVSNASNDRAGNYKATYVVTDPGNFALPNNAESIEMEFQIAKLDLHVVFNPKNKTLTYSGSYETLDYALADSSGKTGYDIYLVQEAYTRLDGTMESQYPVDAGTYQVTYTLANDTNHSLSGETVFQFSVGTSQVTIDPVLDTSASHVYDGKDWLLRILDQGIANDNTVHINPTGDILEAADVYITHSVDGVEGAPLVDAGDYTVTLQLAGDAKDNYVLVDDRFEISIAKRTIEVTAPTRFVFPGPELEPYGFDAYYTDPTHNWQADSDLDMLELGWSLKRNGETVDTMTLAGEYEVSLRMKSVGDRQDWYDLLTKNYQFENGTIYYTTTVTVDPATFVIRPAAEIQTVTLGTGEGFQADIELADGWSSTDGLTMLNVWYQKEGSDEDPTLKPEEAGTYLVSYLPAPGYEDSVSFSISGSGDGGTGSSFAELKLIIEEPQTVIPDSGTDPAGIRLWIGYTDGPVLVGSWQVAEEVSGIVYNLLGNWVVCLNPDLPEGEYTFKPVSGG